LVNVNSFDFAERAKWMRMKAQPDIADLPVKLQQCVLAEGRGQRLEASHENELEAHHREPHEPERDGEVGPEPVVRVIRTDDRKDQRRQDHRQVGDHPEHRPYDERHRQDLSSTTA
jgi:hypothetical protein